MARPTRLSIAKNDIRGHFDNSPKKVYSQKEIAAILAEQRSFWRLARSTTAKEFIRFLTEQGSLKTLTFRSEAYAKELTRYSWGSASIYESAISLRKSGYFSHGTAVSLHQLTDLIPRTIYLNVEQSSKPDGSGVLTQAGINQAFSRKQRQSNLSYAHDQWDVTIVSGKNTNRLGVQELIGPASEHLPVTNLERTLIDIVVRPAYAGGIGQVLQAYQRAKKDVSTNRLVALLKKLNYVYPYHQAIGFLMERAGYKKTSYALLQALGMNFDFYLVHGLQSPEFHPGWRLFYPKGLEA